jgi:sensor histidine kinase YesM
MSKSNHIISIVTHIVAGTIAGLFLVFDVFVNELNIWEKSETVLAILVFYIHGIILLPQLFNTKNTLKYIALTFILFAFEAVLSSVFAIASKPDYKYIFTKILNSGPAFGTNIEGLYKFKFLNALLLFSLSFLYGIFVLNKKDKIQFLTGLIFDKKPTELTLHLLILLVISVTFYFANILFSNVSIACFIMFYVNLLFTSFILFEKKQLVTFLVVTLTELSFFTIFLSHFTNITTVFIVSIGISMLTLSTVYAVVRYQAKTNEFAFFRKETELQQLKSQINPHFLFNALNTLYSFALKENAEKTASNIKKFSSLIRFTLSDIEKDFIPLEKEIGYIHDYIDIQLARCPVSQHIELNFTKCDKKNIAPLLLIPFVENAFKHGINPMKESELKITIDCTPKTILFQCINSICELKQIDIEREGFGIGIENIKSRLNAIYPYKHKLEINNEDNFFKVRLEIND